MNFTFLKKNPFWLGCVAGVVVLVGLYFGLVFPKVLKVNALSEKVNDLQTAMDKLAQGGLARPEWIDAVREERLEKERGFGEAALRLMELDNQLESFISKLPEGSDVPDGSIYKEDYLRRTEKLVRDLEKQGVAVRPGAFNFEQFGGSIPDRDQIKESQKHLWVQEAVATALPTNHVLEVRYMNFLSFDHERQRDNPFFIRPQFETVLRMRYPDLGQLVADLLNSPRRIRVLEVKVEREVPELLPGVKEPTKGALVEIISLRCDYLDPTIVVQQVRFDLQRFPKKEEDIKAWIDREKGSTDPARAGISFLARKLDDPNCFQIGKAQGNDYVIQFCDAKKDIESDKKKFKTGLGLQTFSPDEGVSVAVGPQKLEIR